MRLLHLLVFGLVLGGCSEDSLPPDTGVPAQDMARDVVQADVTVDDSSATADLSDLSADLVPDQVAAGDSPGCTPDTTVKLSPICDAYLKMCSQYPKTQKIYASCKSTCVDAPGTPPTVYEQCGFVYCAVEVGLCDNQEPGDPTILACMKQHCWSYGP